MSSTHSSQLVPGPSSSWSTPSISRLSCPVPPPKCGVLCAMTPSTGATTFSGTSRRGRRGGEGRGRFVCARVGGCRSNPGTFFFATPTAEEKKYLKGLTFYFRVSTCHVSQSVHSMRPRLSVSQCTLATTWHTQRLAGRESAISRGPARGEGRQADARVGGGRAGACPGQVGVVRLGVAAGRP